MTERDRILAAVRGQAADRLPWVPRLDFWYRARSRNGTLPCELRSLSLFEIADCLGAGRYATIPDFTEGPDEIDMLDYAIGIFRLPVLPFRATIEGVDRRVVRRGRETTIEYRTPVGSVRTATIFTDEMLDAGASVPWRTEHAIERPQDFEVVGYIFEHTRVEPCWDGWRRRSEEVGDRGVAVVYCSGSACPVHHILRELMPVDQFFYAMHDCPAAVERLAERMEPYYRRIKEIAADGPGEIVLLGGNYDDSITYPAFFARHILPALRDYAEVLHGKGKHLMTHTDGENRKLLPLYREAGFDIADSVCPAPMTRCNLEELREGFGTIAIWGGIPSVLLCASSTGEGEFRRTIDDLIERHTGSARLILGVSDMVTADAEWSRLEYIGSRLAGAAFGAC
jgi:hypothetical protein